MTQLSVQGKADHQKALDEANQAQKRASNPLASVFVSASAGSGKTKLLIDRLLRLMLPLEQVGDDGRPVLLEGSDPSRILCLTYTKAAAAEMAHRLQSHLGRWVSLPDEKLGEALTALDVPATPATRERARGLFLKVLDAPGGLQIETIHAFCQSLLRRFPLEAALDPHFVLMEEADSQMALRRALEDSLAQDQDPVQVLATLTGFDRLMGLLGQFNARSGLLQPLLERWTMWPGQVEQAYRRLLGAGSRSSAELKREACQLENEELWREEVGAAMPLLAESKQGQFGHFLTWLAQDPADRDDVFLTSLLFTQKGEVRNMSRHLGARARKAAPGLEQRLLDEAGRQQEMQERIRTQRLLEINTAFLALALPVMGRFADEKRNRGAVDYDDLIARTREVLREPGAAWVLYKLDGGIDHLLLDEVQDNSGLQWEIAGALTADFFSGAGVREATPRPRTVFAVGDFKQSIYSFQGAEPEQFHMWRQEFARRVDSAGLLWEEPKLNVSFRSLAPVLTFVDAVFADDEKAGGNEALDGLREQGDRRPLSHQSARSGGGGRVELWPLVPSDRDGAAGEPDDASAGQVADPWRAPEKNEDQRSAQQRLADGLARHIREQVGRPLQPGTAPLKAGDVMILVPKRSAFLRALIRALKARDVPVASFISSGLVEQPAVQDLMTLCDALLLPQDDLSLASVLTSPLGGLSDESLMALATADGRRRELGREGTPLWSLLARRHGERPEWRDAWERLRALYRRVDYDTPYDILMQALGVQGGRARLLARLGAEAAEPVDELLTAALTYETQHPPSLQGFLHWLRASTVESQREVEAGVDAVSIMTVHRSKGLQARLVILPDTTSLAGRSDGLLWTELEDERSAPDGDVMHGPLWIPQVRMGTEQTAELLARARGRQREERNRLLYVALTRASDALLICGWEPRTGSWDSSWYGYCQAGMERLEGVQALPFEGDWEGERLVLEMPVTAVPDSVRRAGPAHVTMDLPGWMGQAPDWQVQPAPREDALARPLAPSRPEAAVYGPLPAARSPLDIVREGLVVPQPASRRQDAMERGTLVHRLLQFLPDLPAAERRGKAEAWLRHTMPGLAEEEVTSLAGHVVSVVEMEALAPLFGPGSRAEQGISGTLGQPGDGTGRVVLGQVDRFRFDGQTVWLCDYKTGRSPSRPDRVPPAYLKQMASYRRVMQGLHPGHPVRCFLVWVDGPAVTELPADLLEEQVILPG